MTSLVECARCIMNSRVDPNIQINSEAICNHCQRYDTLRDARILGGESGKIALEALVSKIRKSGQGKEYDCIVGVSGGVDSTYVAYLVKKFGLRPLAIHLDNGWNSELAVKNIERTLGNLDIDLYTHVLDWEEFRGLQIAFLKASTPDGEIPTDHAISALLWREAVKRGIKYVISGMNFTTEAISIPDWAYGHSDWRYIKGINREFGEKSLKSYPHFSFPYLFYANFIRNIRIISILDYVSYNKNDAMQFLQDEIGWKYYGGKHYESVYTRFYQGYILPKKFGIDKRYGHLSDLINAGQISREAALKEIQEPGYPEELFREDFIFVRKKLGMTETDFNEVMDLPVKSFRDYKNSYPFVQFLRNLINKLRRAGLYPR